MSVLEMLEGLSYIVTIIGLPFAIFIFMYEQRRERLNEDEEIYQRLSDEYANFLKLLLEHSDLQLFRKRGQNVQFTDEQNERCLLIYEILVALFERAYILVYEDEMDKQTQRLWASWEDYIREWCRREDFRRYLPEMLKGEDVDFQKHILKIAEQEQTSPTLSAAG